MKKFIKYFLISFFVVCSLLFVVCSKSNAAYYYPHYFITGSISDTDGHIIDKKVYFYKSISGLQQSSFVSVPASAVYILNAFAVIPPPQPFAVVGEDCYAFIPTDNPADPANGYGADGVKVTLSGRGLDTANLEIKKGGGRAIDDGGSDGYVQPPAVGGVPPLFEWIKFGDRVYQKQMVEKSDYQFIVSSTPNISAKINSNIDISSNSLKIFANEGGAPDAKRTFAFDLGGIKTSAVGAISISDLSKPFSFSVPKEQKLVEGKNEIKFYVENTSGQATYEIATVVVVEGPVQVIGEIITYPSPFFPPKDRTTTIQYTLSADANIDLFFFSPTGEIIKKIMSTAGTNGGAAGVNKITWDGKKASGATVGNAIYSGALVDHDQGKVLKKFKLPISDYSR